MRTQREAMAEAVASGVLQAWLLKQKIEFRGGDEGRWFSFDGVTPDLFSPNHYWRVATTPTLRPWKPEEVPVVAMGASQLGWAGVAQQGRAGAQAAAWGAPSGVEGLRAMVEATGEGKGEGYGKELADVAMGM